MRLLTLLLALCALLVFADATRLTTRVQAYRNCPGWCHKIRDSVKRKKCLDCCIVMAHYPNTTSQYCFAKHIHT